LDMQGLAMAVVGAASVTRRLTAGQGQEHRGAGQGGEGGGGEVEGEREREAAEREEEVTNSIAAGQAVSAELLSLAQLLVSFSADWESIATPLLPVMPTATEADSGDAEADTAETGALAAVTSDGTGAAIVGGDADASLVSAEDAGVAVVMVDKLRGVVAAGGSGSGSGSKGVDTVVDPVCLSVMLSIALLLRDAVVGTGRVHPRLLPRLVLAGLPGFAAGRGADPNGRYVCVCVVSSGV
jgi:hypothetical protein